MLEQDVACPTCHGVAPLPAGPPAAVVALMRRFFVAHARCVPAVVDLDAVPARRAVAAAR